MYIPKSPIQFAPLFDIVVKKYDLPYDAFLLGNNSAMSPYSNSVHTRNVVVDSLLIYTHMNPCGVEYANPISIALCKTLLTAALMHDYGHSSGRLSDPENIKVACDAVTAITGYTGLDLDYIKTLIKCTEYYKGFSTKPVSTLAHVLRDADICTIFHVYDTDGLAQYEGLFTELNTELHSRNKPMLSNRDFVRAISTFLKNAKFYTPIGNMLKDTYLDQCLEVFKEYFMSGDTRKARELAYRYSL